jgi:hypothetical protein
LPHLPLTSLAPHPHTAPPPARRPPPLRPPAARRPTPLHPLVPASSPSTVRRSSMRRSGKSISAGRHEDGRGRRVAGEGPAAAARSCRVVALLRRPPSSVSSALSACAAAYLYPVLHGAASSAQAYSTV